MKFEKIKISKEHQKLISDFTGWEECPIELDFRHIMAIIEKIEWLFDGGFEVGVHFGSTLIDQCRDSDDGDLHNPVKLFEITESEGYDSEDKIGFAHEAIIQFINWYDYRWICTDPDCDQWGRKLSETTFEFKEGGTQAIIDLKKYSDEQKQHILDAYTLKLTETENMTIAECIFEVEKAPAREI